MSIVKLPSDCPATTALMMFAIGSGLPATGGAGAPAHHLSASVTFLQSASLSFSTTAVASWALASNCFANASPFAPIGILLDREVGRLTTAQLTITLDVSYGAEDSPDVSPGNGRSSAPGAGGHVEGMVGRHARRVTQVLPAR